MTKIIQLMIISFIIVLSLLFYKTYFVSLDKENKTNKKNTFLEKENENIYSNKDNNLIDNLSYNVKLGLNSEYKITAEKGELQYFENVEIINMKRVNASFKDESGNFIKIYSDEALYNSSNYNTKFTKNIIINYLDHEILAETMEADIKERTILIYDNVRYEGNKISANSDIVKVDLEKKKINILMADKNKKITISNLK